MNDDELKEFTDFSKEKIEMTKESEGMIKLIRTNVSKLFNRDVSIAEIINMLVAMGIEEWAKMQEETENEDLI